MSHNVQQRVGFIRDLDIPVIRGAEAVEIPGGAPVPVDKQQGGFVDGGNLISFVSGVSAQKQADALNSMLLAQLAASRKFNREEQILQWYDFYKTVLENVGWVLQKFDFQKYAAAGSTVKMEKVVLEVLAGLAAGANAIAVVTAALDALKSLADADGRLQLWNRATLSTKGASFQVGAASEVGGQMAVKLGAFYFKSSRVDTRFLWFGFSSTDVELYRSGQEATLDEGVYQQVRAEVEKKLGDKAKTFVASLDIGDL